MLGAALLLGLAGCAPEPQTAPGPEVLSATKAGGLYLDAVCPVNEAWDAADLEIDRLRIAQTREETDTDDFAEAMRAVGEASAEAARRLEPKDRTWPESATDEIAAVRETLRADAKQAAKVAEMPIDDVLDRGWAGAEEVGTAAAAARAALGLPTDPVAACAQWEQQRAEAKAAESHAAEAKAEPEEATARAKADATGEGSDSRAAADSE